MHDFPNYDDCLDAKYMGCVYADTIEIYDSLHGGATEGNVTGASARRRFPLRQLSPRRKCANPRRTMHRRATTHLAISCTFAVAMHAPAESLAFCATLAEEKLRLRVRRRPQLEI